MKKLLIVLFVSVTTLAANAQFGINLGLNIANLGGKDATEANLGADKKGKLAPQGGIYYNAAISDNFSIQPEAMYFPAGVTLEDAGVEGKIALTYINIGALARWNSGSGFYLGTGPNIGLLMAGKIKVDGQPDTDIKDDLKGADFGWLFRAGYDLASGLGFYAGFTLGFSTIDDSSPADDIKNRVISVGVRYNLTKGAAKEKK